MAFFSGFVFSEHLLIVFRFSLTAQISQNRSEEETSENVYRRALESYAKADISNNNRQLPEKHEPNL